MVLKRASPDDIFFCRNPLCIALGHDATLCHAWNSDNAKNSVINSTIDEFSHASEVYDAGEALTYGSSD